MKKQTKGIFVPLFIVAALAVAGCGPIIPAHQPTDYSLTCEQIKHELLNVELAARQHQDVPAFSNDFLARAGVLRQIAASKNCDLKQQAQ